MDFAHSDCQSFAGFTDTHLMEIYIKLSSKEEHLYIDKNANKKMAFNWNDITTKELLTIYTKC